MPKRSLDSGRSGPTTEVSDKIQKKTERSHEENQERAYIAASRRADRSIEARVQSARMASEIHKKRTGKSFRITEEIVRKEEMYEEEEDDMPRSYRLLGPHMQTSSPEMNKRVEAYLSNRVAMSAYITKMNDEWRENHINQLFAASFPNIGQQARRLSQSITSPTGQQPPTPQGPASTIQSPVSPTSNVFSPPNYQQQDARQAPRGSMSAVSPTTHSSGHSTIVGDSLASPTALSPQSSHGTVDTKTHSGSLFEVPTPSSGHEFDAVPESVFTTEFPPEMKLIMGGGAAGGLDMGQVGSGLFDPTFMGAPGADGTGFYGDADLMNPAAMKMHPSFGDNSQLDIYGNRDDELVNSSLGMEEPSWDSFIEEGAWGNTEQ